MSFNFDEVIDRKGTNSIKWKHFPDDVLPLWVADMDFAVPEPILALMRLKTDQRVYGYEMPGNRLREIVAERMQRLYHWQVTADMVLATPGVVAGFNAAARAVCASGEGIVVQPPVYPPFLKVHEFWGLSRQGAPLAVRRAESTLHYEVDFDVFEKAFGSGGARTAMFLLCNPHNPTGEVYSRSELARMAHVCMENRAVIVSDEIHSELLLGGTEFMPIAAISPEIADRTITLAAPSKTFNVPGLFCGFAIIPNKELRQSYQKVLEGLTMHVSSFGLAAAEVAYSGACDEWLAALQQYLTTNRDFVANFVKAELNGVRATLPEATYLTWMDFNELVQAGRMDTSPFEYLLQHARVGLNDGKEFGAGGEGFVRLNFGCPRSTLQEALHRIKDATI